MQASMSHLVLALTILYGLLCPGLLLASNKQSAVPKYYRIVDGAVDAKTYNGFRRYHASCNHCHGSDGLGSTFGPSLVERLPDIAEFRLIVRYGKATGESVMQGFADDPNIAPYVDDIYSYLQGRADGAIGRGRPRRQK
jgi:mono/diheme cytochrome c family protein